ncbi:hypothetical protein [uncultured Pseudacidovorax sp.]|nr:hypothetical protein [uncultured Pseudacidovorax sp.]
MNTPTVVEDLEIQDTCKYQATGWGFVWPHAMRKRQGRPKAALV